MCLMFCYIAVVGEEKNLYLLLNCVHVSLLFTLAHANFKSLTTSALEKTSFI